MAPKKILSKGGTLLPTRKTVIMTKSKINTINDQNVDPINEKNGKRKADQSPIQIATRVKRSALANLTNTVINRENETKKVLGKKQQPTAQPTVNAIKKNIESGRSKLENYGFIAPRPTKVMTRAAARATVVSTSSSTSSSSSSSSSLTLPPSVASVNKCDQETIVKQKDTAASKVPQKSTNLRRISNEFEKTEDSLYMSALEEFSSAESIRNSPNTKVANKSTRKSVIVNTTEDDANQSDYSDNSSSTSEETVLCSPPAGVCDFDMENWNDPFQVSEYAIDVFQYLKSRESHFQITDYMARQKQLSVWMRTLLIDWMVEVQETFELNHETLYLAVKLVDMYLGKVLVVKERLQLLGAASLLIASKYDERTPPLIDDFLYICDNAYKKEELIKMEKDLFSITGFDLSIPLSYRFLRRYARVSKVTMPILTLARFILEFSLMDYTTVTFRDSQVACASLFIALRMSNKPGWDITLEYYSGYKLKDFANIVPILNAGLHQKPRETIKTVRSKYSHKIFFEVAKIPLMKTEELFKDSGFIVVDEK